ncbi:aromatic-amino-acid aminotransferase [Penicillium maclennaniae]|uniref:aromatic-amino-acid aminotransferase n=1 Tax=Penicillium maclennaniae TaxID=1343394 RepID=UPI002540959A|nr:aromatic-amino-acid aminotransferase [Penicillium maclennaniae]KAJ5662630.1 aromatic-amino-acid aminotransferase [Penicillium maclennaniae]
MQSVSYLGAFDWTDRDFRILGLVIRDCSETEEEEDYHFYMADNSQVSIYIAHKDHQRQGLPTQYQLITFRPWRAGKNEGNVEYVARSINQCLQDAKR